MNIEFFTVTKDPSTKKRVVCLSLRNLFHFPPSSASLSLWSNVSPLTTKDFSEYGSSVIGMTKFIFLVKTGNYFLFQIFLHTVHSLLFLRSICCSREDGELFSRVGVSCTNTSVDLRQIIGSSCTDTSVDLRQIIGSSSTNLRVRNDTCRYRYLYDLRST